jgi:dTDP-4-amino-4,6-dideoxygalactose transaminase
LNGISNPNIILPVPNNTDFKYVENQEHVWHLFVIRTDKRDELQNYLLAQGVQTLIHYPIPPNKQLAYASMNHLDYSITNVIHEQVLSLPISPVTTVEEVQKIIEVLNNFK